MAMDAYAVLGEPRRPWLDVEALKTRYLALSAESHPDRVHGGSEAERAEAARRAMEVNSAHAILSEPRARLLHLLELETGRRPADIQRIPAGTMDLFVEVGQCCREVDDFLSERDAVTSPVLKVRMFERGMEWVGRLRGLQESVRRKGAALEEELRGMNAAWEAAPVEGSGERAGVLPLGRLEEIYRVLSYVARWTEQIQERVVRLAAV